MTRFLIALVALLPLAVNAASISKFSSISVSATNFQSEAVVTNGLTLGGVRNTSWPAGGIVGTVSNNVASAGLLAVDSTKTNGIAATFAHVTNALGYVPVNKAGDTMTGALLLPTGSFTAPSLGFSAATNVGIYFGGGGNGLAFAHGGALDAYFNTAGDLVGNRANQLIALPATGGYAFAGGPTIYRDDGNTLALRNGVNAQAFNIYNTYTDAANYERAYGRWVGNVYTIGTEALGTGVQRPLQIMMGTNVLSYSGSNLTWNGVAITVP